MNLLKFLLNALMYLMRALNALHTGLLELKTLPILYKLWELSYSSPEISFPDSNLLSSFARFQPMNPHWYSARHKETPIQFLELFLWIVPAFLGFCSVKASHFVLLELQALSFQLTKTSGLYLGFQKESLRDCRAYLICFPSLRDYCPTLLVF